MPEMQFVVRWPDDSIMVCYSPSLVIREYLEAGTVYPVTEFVERSRTALQIAAKRVREKYGYACVRAENQLSQIEARALAFRQMPGAAVRVESYCE